MFQNLRHYYRITVTDLRYQSVQVLLWRILVKLFSPVLKFDLQILFDLDLTQPVQVRQSKVACVITQAGEDAIDDILDMQMPRLSPEQTAQLSDADELQHARMLRVRAKAYDTYLRSMRAGEQCFVARVDGVIAHSNWICAYGCAPTEACSVHLKPGEIYSTDGFTREMYRGLRLHEAVATYMLDLHKQRGYQRAYTITDITKAGSRRGVKRIGWRRRGSILYLTPRHLKRTWLVRLDGDVTPLFTYAGAAMASERLPLATSELSEKLTNPGANREPV